jgi:hypothetical protein
MRSDKAVSVLIPTLATIERAQFLHKAIDSVIAQNGVKAVPIVIANGPQCNPGVLTEIGKEIRLAVLEDANMSKALLHGRRMVETPYFSELDDDDLLLPHALHSRLSALEQTPEADVVVSNGLLRDRGQEFGSHEGICACAADPLRSLLDQNWLYPGAALFRAESVGPEFFSEMPRYLQWTYLATRLALQRKIVFIDCPSFVHYMDLPFSVWASREYTVGRPEGLQSILNLDLPIDVKRRFELKMGQACDTVSRIYFSEGKFLEAWKWYRRVGRAGPRGGLPRRLLSFLARKSIACLVPAKRSHGSDSMP